MVLTTVSGSYKFHRYDFRVESRHCFSTGVCNEHRDEKGSTCCKAKGGALTCIARFISNQINVRDLLAGKITGEYTLKEFIVKDIRAKVYEENPALAWKQEVWAAFIVESDAGKKQTDKIYSEKNKVIEVNKPINLKANREFTLQVVELVNTHTGFITLHVYDIYVDWEAIVDVPVEQIPRVKVDVMVMDQEGNPIVGANVKLSGLVSLESRSGGDGIAEFDNVPIGKYVVKVEAVGYIPAENEIEIKNNPTVVKVYLKKRGLGNLKYLMAGAGIAAIGVIKFMEEKKHEE